MSDFTKRYLIAAVLIMVTAFMTFGAYSTRSYNGVLYTQNIPMIMGDNWYGKRLPMDERTYDVLETRDAFVGEYRNSGNEKVLFTVIFAKSNRKVAHPPEVCLVGGGWSRINKDLETLMVASSGGDRKTLKMNSLTLRRGAEEQVVLYLYKAGKRFTPNYYTQQFNIILNSMLYKDTSSALIRISSMTDGDVEGAKSRIREFAEEVIPILEKRLP